SGLAVPDSETADGPRDRVLVHLPAGRRAAWHPPPLHQAPPAPIRTARSNGVTGSTPRSSGGGTASRRSRRRRSGCGPGSESTTSRIGVLLSLQRTRSPYHLFRSFLSQDTLGEVE